MAIDIRKAAAFLGKQPLLTLAGAALISTGVICIYLPAGLIVAGLLLVAIEYMIGE